MSNPDGADRPTEATLPASMQVPATDENGCYTLPDGSCVSEGPCLHTSPNVCPWCQGKGTLPGNNAPVQGFSAPNCWHCNGQGVVKPPEPPTWVDRVSR